MEKCASILFGTKKIKQNICDNNNNEVGLSATSNKNVGEGLEDANVGKKNKRSAQESSAPPLQDVVQSATSPIMSPDISRLSRDDGEEEAAEEEDEEEGRQQDEISRRASKLLRKMSNDELIRLLTSERSSMFDRLLKRVPTIRKLEHERNALKEEVLNLAYCNQAREPEFVRDRLKLRELTRDVTQLIKQLAGKHVEPMVNNLKRQERQLTERARSLEEQSEAVARIFLETSEACGATTTTAAAAAAPATVTATATTTTVMNPADGSRSSNSSSRNSGCLNGEDVFHEERNEVAEWQRDATGAADDGTGSTTASQAPEESQVQAFIEAYIGVRKGAIKKRTLADKLSKELDLLSSVSNNISTAMATAAATNAQMSSNAQQQNGARRRSRQSPSSSPVCRNVKIC